jgi:predicted dehydrogenase
VTAFKTEAPLRIGIVGLGRLGRHHLQRLGLRADCRVVAVYDPSQVERSLPTADAVPRFPTWQAFLAVDGLEVVWVCTPLPERARFACAALAAGKHVIVEQPFCANLAEADAIGQAAEEARRMALGAATHRGDGEFRTPWALVQSGKLGLLKLARLTVQQFVPALGREPRESVLLEFGGTSFDQLLQLIPEPVTRVFAQINRPDPRAADDEFRVLLQFENGAVAQVEISLNSFVPLNTGWILNGTHGGYAQGIHYRATAEGELIDAPLAPLPTDEDAFYAGLVGHLRRGEQPPATAAEARRLVAVLEAVLRSASAGDWAAVGA